MREAACGRQPAAANPFPPGRTRTHCCVPFNILPLLREVLQQVVLQQVAVVPLEVHLVASNSFRSLASKGFPRRIFDRWLCVSAFTQKLRTYEVVFANDA